MNDPVAPKIKGHNFIVPDHIIHAPMRLPHDPSIESSKENGSNPPKKGPTSFPRPSQLRSEIQESLKEQPKISTNFPPHRVRNETQETLKDKTAATVPKTLENDSSSKNKSATLNLISKGKVDDVVIYKLLVELVKNIDNESGIDFFVESLFHNMLLNAVNAISVSKYIFLLSHLPRKGQMLRASFFKFLQKRYNERNLILMSQGEESFKNFVNFFTAAVHHNRDPTLAPFDELISSLLDLAEMFSNYIESPADLKLFCVILVRFSQYENLDPKIYSSETVKKYWKIKDIIRKKILSENDHKSKNFIWLIMAIDNLNCSSVTDFYTNNMDRHELTPVLKDAYTITFPLSDFELYKNIQSMRPYLNLI